jgi:hypothetical protein
LSAVSRSEAPTTEIGTLTKRYTALLRTKISAALLSTRSTADMRAARSSEKAFRRTSRLTRKVCARNATVARYEVRYPSWCRSKPYRASR